MINSFGTIFKLTSFGESHGKALGGVIDGCPAGVSIDEDFIQQEMDRRRPGQSRLTTARNEPDSVEFLSGIFEGKTTAELSEKQLQAVERIMQEPDILRVDSEV